MTSVNNIIPNTVCYSRGFIFNALLPHVQTTPPRCVNHVLSYQWVLHWRTSLNNIKSNTIPTPPLQTHRRNILSLNYSPLVFAIDNNDCATVWTTEDPTLVAVDTFLSFTEAATVLNFGLVGFVFTTFKFILFLFPLTTDAWA